MTLVLLPDVLLPGTFVLLVLQKKKKKKKDVWEENEEKRVKERKERKWREAGKECMRGGWWEKSNHAPF